jgi:uncharacterized protein YutE (UPF0331/DUF86 family)
MRIIRQLEATPEDLRESAERLRRFRNQLVHGIEIPDVDLIRSQTAELGALLGRLREIYKPKRTAVRKKAKQTQVP